MTNRRRPVSSAHILYYVLLSLGALIVLIPFLWMVATSFDRVNSYELPYPPRFIPENPSLFNYQIATKNMPIYRYLLNTTIIAALSTALSLVITSLAGFCISKGRFPGKGLLMLVLLSNMMIPFEAKLMPMFRIIKGLGLTNTYLGVVLPGVMTNAMFIFFVKKFCDDLPSDLYEAGVIDGAGKLRIWGQIFLPLMGPVLATLVILNVMNNWNDLLWPMVLLTKNRLKTVQIGLALYSSDSAQTHAGVATALSVLSVLPLGLLFTFLQKYIVQSIASTGLKQ